MTGGVAPRGYTNKQTNKQTKGEFSEWADVLSGVIQGSVLEPALFLLYISDKGEYADCEAFMSRYADDTKVATVIKSDRANERLQLVIKRLEIWC